MREKAILDHGYVALVETWGSDQRIVESARMSTNKGFLGWGPLCVDCDPPSTADINMIANPDNTLGCAKCGAGGLLYKGDEKLLRFLYEKGHSTPFEFGGLTFEVQAPLMVFREWHRHRVPFGYSEQSARYVEMPELFYVPSVERLTFGGQSTMNRQASGVRLDDDTVTHARLSIEKQCKDAFSTYRLLLATGIAKELARLVLPVNTYSRMRATGNLRGWLGFLGLRMAPGAQWEIRQYANSVGELIAEAFPRTWELFTEGKEES